MTAISKALSFIKPSVILALYCLCTSSARDLREAQSPNPAVQQESVLLAFARRFSNFQEVQSENRFQGWNSTTAACSGTGQSVTSIALECDPSNRVYRSASRNSWTGVICNPAGQVICLHLAGLGLRGSASSLSVLKDLPSLQYLNLDDNKVYGGLPEAAGSVLNSLEILYLSENVINSTLEESWGSPSSWPQMQKLSLQDNYFYGTLPSSWAEVDRWQNLRLLNVSNNHLQGGVPVIYNNASAFPSLQLAVLVPGNSFCGTVPPEFPAYKAAGVYLTGTSQASVTDLGRACTKQDEIDINPDWYGDHAGDELSSTAIAGILAGEVLLGAFLLLLAGIIHRRYRWRSERSWVLFDWDVVAEKTPPKPFSFVSRFGLGPKHSQNGMFGQNPSLGTLSPARTGSASMELAEVAALNGNIAPRVSNAGSFPEQIWQDSLVEPEDVRLQQNSDGSFKQLGNGSFGKVYKGVLTDVHEVAVKVFEGYVGQRERELLLKEITILRSCRNKNIVQFFGVAFQGDDIWMIMELMESNLFRHLARGHHCTWYFRGRSIALDIARGMHFLHSRRIVHMDLKSPNILLGESGTAKIADVGLARVMGSDSIINQVCAGTMHWMAPEVLIYGQCTEKADIFSFGVILWELCTAEAPTRGRMNPVSVPDECPEDVANLIEQCMHEDSKKRPSALEIITKIQAIPITSRPVPQPPWYAR